MQDYMNKVKKAVGYIRVSTKRQEESGIGLAWQTDEIRFAACQFGYLLDHIYEDTHTGRGNHSLVRRNGLQDAIDEARRESPCARSEDASAGVPLRALTFGSTLGNQVAEVA